MGTTIKLIYGFLSPPIPRKRPSNNDRILGRIGGGGGTHHAFVRTYRISGTVPRNAIERCEAQWRFLYQQKILLNHLPQNKELRRQYIELEKLWMQLTGGGSGRLPTHFIELGIVPRLVRNHDRVLYNPSRKVRAKESIFFKGAFCFVAPQNDRDCDYLARMVSHMVLGYMESDFEDYDGAALDPSRAWILQRIMSAWKKLNNL